MKPIGAYGWAYGLPISKDKDNVKATYTNLRNDVKIGWTKTAQKVYMDDLDQEGNWFESDLALEFGAPSKRFGAKQFHFHSPSEHTLNGKHYDMEMHIVHVVDPGNGSSDGSKIKYGVVGLMFSVEHFNEEISTQANQTVQDFFNDLKLDDLSEPVVESVSLGNLMKEVNMEGRWVYHGSLTAPPCAPYVYWNVINFVYPIRKEEFAKIQHMMAKRSANIGGLTNNRPIQDIKDH